MDSHTKIAFIDASGNENITKIGTKGVSTVYLISAIILDKSKEFEIDKEANKIRKKYFQSGDMKSSKLGIKDHKKRLSILKDISKLDIKIIPLVIEKQLLYGEGLKKSKQVFVKFLHDILYNVLYKMYPKLYIVQDQYGDKKFMDGFASYAKGNYPGQIRLFNDPNFQFVNSKSNNLIQVTDFIAGSFSMFFDKDKFYPESEEYLRILEPINTGFQKFPNHSAEYIDELNSRWEDIDYDISEISRRLASNYIMENENSDKSYIKKRVYCLKYLLHKFDLNPLEYTHADEIVRFIDDDSLDTEKLRRSIINKLRDEEVLISSNKKGYKLPANRSDCINYFDKCLEIIAPMLRRLDLFTKTIKRVSSDNFDLVAITKYKQIKKALAEDKIKPKVESDKLPITIKRIPPLN